MKINLNAKQRNIITQKFELSVKILQMGCQELTAYIEQAAMENPVMEVDYSFDELNQQEQFKRKLEWLDSIDEQNKVYYQSIDDEKDEHDLTNYKSPFPHEDGLQTFLMDQLNPITLDKTIYRIAEHIASSLDENGYLYASIDQTAALLNTSKGKVEQALRVIQSLEPWGIGARNLKECLLIQLEKKDMLSPELDSMVNNYLEELSQSKFNLVSNALKIPIERVKELYSIIKNLNPKPGSAFSQVFRPDYIIPDIIVVKYQNYYDVLLNDFTLPSIKLSRSYINMISSINDIETIKYINNKLDHAKWIIKCIEQRKDTMLSVAKAVVDIQTEFFEKGPRYLKSMLQRDISDRLGISESTVSRAIRGKYMQTQWGTYDLKYFFPYRINASASTPITSNDIKTKIKEILRMEDVKKPYSDYQISSLLSQEGINISRRTVAKYREEMNIPNASGRREY